MARDTVANAAAENAVPADHGPEATSQIGPGPRNSAVRRRKARRLTLHLPTRWPWGVGWHTALMRLRTIPPLA